MNLETLPKALINLPSRKDRLIEATKEIDSFFYNKAIINIDGVIDDKPMVGIAKAHLNAIRYAKEKGYDNILIMEDDLLFRPNAKEYAINAFHNLPNDYDILLGGIYNGKKTYHNDYWNKVGAFSGLHFYVVNHKAYDKILNNFKFNQHIDRWLVAVANLDCYVTNKFFCIQRNGYSDNAKTFCNYDYLLNESDLL